MEPEDRSLPMKSLLQFLSRKDSSTRLAMKFGEESFAVGFVLGLGAGVLGAGFILENAPLKWIGATIIIGSAGVGSVCRMRVRDNFLQERAAATGFSPRINVISFGQRPPVELSAPTPPGD